MNELLCRNIVITWDHLQRQMENIRATRSRCETCRVLLHIDASSSLLPYINTPKAFKGLTFHFLQSVSWHHMIIQSPKPVLVYITLVLLGVGAFHGPYTYLKKKYFNTFLSVIHLQVDNLESRQQNKPTTPTVANLHIGVPRLQKCSYHGCNYSKL